MLPTQSMHVSAFSVSFTYLLGIAEEWMKQALVKPDLDCVEETAPCWQCSSVYRRPPQYIWHACFSNEMNLCVSSDCTNIRHHAFLGQILRQSSHFCRYSFTYQCLPPHVWIAPIPPIFVMPVFSNEIKVMVRIAIV